MQPFSVCRGIHVEQLHDLHGPEWLIANKLGGYASGTVCGPPTRGYHALLVAALPAPLGRIVMLQMVRESLEVPGSGRLELCASTVGPVRLVEFHLEDGLPVWRFEAGACVIEKRAFMPQSQNTIHVLYRMLDGRDAVLHLRPCIKFRPLNTGVDVPLHEPEELRIAGSRFEVRSGRGFPPLRIMVPTPGAEFSTRDSGPETVDFPLEQARGYAGSGSLWSVGVFSINLTRSDIASFSASTESWETVSASSAEEGLLAERRRRRRLIERAAPAAQTGLAAELVLASDAFIISPAMSRQDELPRARAADDDVRSVIAGYHWFTDWGRDTMISLEGLTLVTGRHEDAGYILRTFARYVRDGLIPNLFREGDEQAMYHTADATLWFFHALARYVETTGDRSTLRQILPKLVEVFEHHVRGTRFGIRIDPQDGLLTQGAAGYQLTWMDAKAGDWVVTPRRGKAVELNALWYNALRLLERWLLESADHQTAERVAECARRAYRSFTRRFWNEQGGYLYDVVDGESGDDPSLRPNQILAISLDHPVLERNLWRRVVDIVSAELLTPFGLRTLARGHPDYDPQYDGDLHARDAAYHQGTVWPWLMGPFLDAWLKVYPADPTAARRLLAGLDAHLSQAGVGYISEIFDAEPPFHPRGCIAQAWSVAEVLRSLVRLEAELGQDIERLAVAET